MAPFGKGADARPVLGTPGGSRPRFPGFDVIAQSGSWDAVTAGVVRGRLGRPPALRFFNLDEQAVAGSLFDLLLDQRRPPRVPVLELVDARLAERQTDGWHHADLPRDGVAFRHSLAALDEESRAAHGRRFADLTWDERGRLVQVVRDGAGSWRGLPAAHLWSLWTRYACTAFYAHPLAWNEIGFGGPAYPRGYKNLGLDAREPWEVRDHASHDPVAGQ